MEATKLLEKQHREVDALFERCLDESVDQMDREEAFGELADVFAAHALIEEKIFYPSVFIGDLKEKLRESVEEHLAAKRLVADILQSELTEETWRAKCTVLQEEIEHHVTEEEDKLFPKVRKELSRDDLEAMGEEMEKLYLELKAASPRGELRDQVGRAVNLDEETGHP